MLRFKNMILLAFVTGSLLGCSVGQNVRIGAKPDDYRRNYPVSVVAKERYFMLPVVPGGTSLSAPQRSIIHELVNVYNERGEGPIIIRTPGNLPVNRNNARQRRQVVSELIRNGHTPITGLPFRNNNGSYAFRLEFQTLETETKPCGQWPADLLDSQSNRHYANFGCAVRSNLAAQIANPRDLIQPRTITSIDAERRSNVIDDYRTAPTNKRSEIFY